MAERGDTDGGALTPRAQAWPYVTRRDLLKLLGGAAGVAAFPRPAWALVDTALGEHTLSAPNLLAVVVPPETFRVTALRRDDGLLLTFIFYNLTVTGSTNRMLKRQNAAKKAYVGVQFEGQHLLEQAVSEGTTPPAPPVGALLAGTSRLVFQVPTATTKIPYTLASLLDWTGFVPNLAAGAHPKSGATQTPTQPAATETSIEAPWGLFMSPDQNGRWFNATAPVTHAGRTELWHTRLGEILVKNQAPVEPPDSAPPMRALWTPNYPNQSNDPIGTTSLTGSNRVNIVTQTASTMNPQTGGPNTPVPATARLLLLSPLGASIDFEATWPDSGVLRSWRHRATTGRDSYVRVEEPGHLWPFGHRASIITITERQFIADTSGAIDGVLVQRKIVVVREPLLDFEGDANQPSGGRDLPFRSVRITTLVSPDLDPSSSQTKVAGVALSDAIWCVRVNTLDDVQFAVVAQDWLGQNIDFTMPLIFVYASAEGAGTIADIRTAYEAAGPRRIADLQGQDIAYAPSTIIGDTSHKTDELTFDTSTVGSAGADRPLFYPRLDDSDGARIRVSAVEQISGSTFGPQSAAYAASYVASDFGNAEVYLTLPSPPSVTYTTDRSGGIGAPNFAPDGMSRQFGAVGSAATLDSGFDPSAFFDTGAALLGALVLSQIIQSIGDVKTDPKSVPQQSTTLDKPGNDPTQAPDSQTVSLTFTPKLKKDEPLHIFSPKTDAKMKISVAIVTPLSGGDPSMKIVGEISSFDLNLFGDGAAKFLVVHFDKVNFTTQTGKKTSVDVSIDGVDFAGPLTFVNDLKNLMSVLGGGLSLDIGTDGVTATYSVPVPNLTIGVLSITNMKLSAGLTIPFDSKPVRVKFAFCEKEHPFTLTVMFLGGGGYFGITIGADGLEEIEAALEFGAQAQLDLGVASGGVYIKAGIYFDLKIDSGVQTVNLTGYFKAGGNVEVLGLVSISIELYLGLTYLDPGKSYGEAKLTLKVQILFFSTSFEVDVQKRFGGGDDPNFGDVITKKNWDDYCGAFAAA